MIVLGGVFLFKIGGKLLPVIIIPVILSAMVVFILKKSFSRKIKEQAIIQAEKNANFYECINGIATIKALSTEEASFERCEAFIVESGEKAISLGSLGNIQNSIQTLLNSLGTLAIYWLGSFLIFDGTITLGQLISFSILSSYFLGPLTRVLTMQAYWQEVIISSQRLSDILDIKEECENEENKEEVKSICGDNIFDDVSFSYGTRGLALNNINITIPQGKKVAFVGTTSSLDSISEQRILKTVYNQSTDVTVIMVAHRLSTIKNCDLIYVFENGNIVEQGNHNELLRKNQKYAELWRMQNE